MVIKGVGKRQRSWITKALSRHLAEVVNDRAPGKRGFHSLRKTSIQELQGAGVVSELRAQIVGYELEGEHHSTNSRCFTVREKVSGIEAHLPGLSAIVGLEFQYGIRAVSSYP